MTSTGLRLSRLFDGQYADFNQGVEIIRVDEGWQLNINRSWVATLPTKRDCVNYWLELTS